jgi:hypothetical protein
MRKALTPTRLLLIGAIVISAAVAVYGLAVAKSVPMIVSGTGVLGISLALLGIVAAGAVVRAGRRGDGAMAFTAAMFGGLCMFGAAGALAIAIVLGQLAASA